MFFPISQELLDYKSKCAKKKRRQQNGEKSFAFQPPPGKVPSWGHASNLPWPTSAAASSSLRGILQLSVVGFRSGILTGVFSTLSSDGSAKAPFSSTVSSRQSRQVLLRRQTDGARLEVDQSLNKV